MNNEPKRIKLTDSPSIKDVKRIPMPSLIKEENIKPDRDSIYIPIQNENSKQDNS